MKKKLSRRDILKLGGLGIVSAGGAAALRSAYSPLPPPGAVHDHAASQAHLPSAHGELPGVGEVDHAANGFDPMSILTDFDYGKVSVLPSGQALSGI